MFDNTAERDSGGVAVPAPGNEARGFYAVFDDLLAVQADLAAGVMPRAARITGRSPLLQQILLRLDGAIGMTRHLLRDRQPRSAEEPAPSGRSRPDAWSAEQQGLAAVHAARSVT